MQSFRCSAITALSTYLRRALESRSRREMPRAGMCCGCTQHSSDFSNFAADGMYSAESSCSGGTDLTDVHSVHHQVADKDRTCGYSSGICVRPKCVAINALILT